MRPHTIRVTFVIFVVHQSFTSQFVHVSLGIIRDSSLLAVHRMGQL